MLQILDIAHEEKSRSKIQPCVIYTTIKKKLHVHVCHTFISSEPYVSIEPFFGRQTLVRNWYIKSHTEIVWLFIENARKSLFDLFGAWALTTRQNQSGRQKWGERKKRCHKNVISFVFSFRCLFWFKCKRMSLSLSLSMKEKRHNTFVVPKIYNGVVVVRSVKQI